MAERPLYTLYKNLKAQNYDVPDDYNKFESALTRDGKGGADNRHAIYENLKAQNFDVPSTYERFYSALFEPRSKTSSRAKGGSVPMSAADRARFSAGAAAISASAKQTMNNAGRYNRLKQRKQKQQKDFGRVNLGTHQTPYGGDANNVVKDDFAYNPETGKTGAYVTSDNENVYSLPEAEQSQAQDVAYQNAVDTGEIPSVLDVRDQNGNYDLQENIGKNGTYLTEEGAQKQFDKKLEDAYARKKEIESAIAEDHRLHGNPLLSYGASIGASNGRTAEQSDYSNKLATSLALVKQLIGALEAVKQYPTSSWGEDALKALDNTAFTAKTWDFGLTDFATMGQMERIKTKMDNNIPLSGSDKMLLKSKLGADAAAALEDEKMGNVYRWTKIAGQSLPFMADFFLTGGYGGITKGISRGALKFAAKRGMGKVGAAILKNTGIVAGDVIGSYAMAGTEQALKTGADIMQRHLGNLYQDEKGDYKFGTFDENGNLLHEGGESIGTALYKGMTYAMVENYTEKLFGHNYGIKKGAVNFMEKHGMNASAEFFKNIGKSGWYTNSKKWMEKFGINGFAEEVMEEEIGIPLHALLDGEGKVSDLLDAKQQLDIIGGMAISVGSMYAMGAGSRPVKGIYNRAQYYRFRNKVNVADSDAQNLMGDNWADIKDKIDNATNEQMGSVLADILRQRDTMTKEQINAAVNYGVNLMKMRGYNIAKTAEMNAKEITNEPTTPEEQHQADIDNAYSEGHDADDADKHDIQIQQEDQIKNLAAALGISEQQLSAMSDEELESLTGQDDKLDQAIYDYQLSSARYQGVVDDAQDKVDLAAHQAEQRVDMYTDQSRGSVRNATIKASGGLEDYGVYIISGNIATHDDGSIDVSNSDDMILYYDPTTNSVEHADALMFAELGEELPADDVKAQAVADAKENAIKEVAGIIDGTVEVGSQFNVTDTDGTEHTYEVLADYGDGTAAISIDGNVVENPYSLADLQQMKDLEDQKRLEAAKAEREQMEKERAAQQTQETEQTQPSFDFNQILNDNGNVVLVDVLDKDGNTKYPDSRLFLIRDAGAKAKVVELKSDGTLVPHAVNKEDVATISSMSLDEYKQAMPETSMIEDNSGENRGGIEVEDNTQPLSEADADNVIAQMESSAETAPDLELTPDNWTAEFGEDGILSTPVGDVKMGENQVAKLFEKGRSKEFGMIKPTLTNPDVIIEVPSHSADGNEERSSSYLFIKTFLGKNGKKVYYFKSVTIRKDGLEISISSHYDRAKRVKETLMKGKLLYRKNDGAQTEQNQPSTSVTTSQEDAAGSSESKDTNISSNGNENNESLTFEDGTPIPVDMNGETDLSQTDAAHAAEWYDNNLGEDADDWLDGEIKKAKKVLEQAKNKKLAGTKPSELVASKKEKEAAIADAQAHYDSAISIRDSLKERRIAKEENTSEGRKELIEKARRKFARLKSAVKDDAEAVSQLYRETIGSLLHRLYDGTGIDVTDTIPLTAEEYVASNLGAHSLNYEGTETSKGVKQETGLSREDFAKTQLLAADGKGTTIDALVHSLWENRPSNLESLDTQDIRNALIGVLNSGFKASEARNFVENIRIAQAENILKEQKRAQENAAYAEQPEAESEAELKAKSDEKAELKAKSEAKLDNESDNESNDLSNETDNEQKNDNINDNVNVPEDATDEAPLGAERDESDLPFSAKENGKQQTTAERAADVEKNKVDDMKVVDNIVGEKTRKAFERLAKMMGANIQWQYSDKLGNGWIQETTDADGNVHRTIFITLDSSITEGAQFIFGHEMTHQIKNLNPAAYNELTQLVLDTYGSDAFDKAVDETMKRYSDAGFSGRSRDYYAEEVVADAVGEMIRDLNLAHTLAMKMSHPLLAAIHEILQKIKLAFYGTEYSDVTKNIIRSIEQAYVKTAKGQVTNSETGEDVSFSLRQKPEPKKKGIGYKVFVLKDGKLYPPMVANPNGAATPVGVWLDADAAPIAGESKTGRPQVKQGGKGTQGGSGKLAYRPGWHLGVVPYAIQFNRKDAEGNKTLFPKNFVFAEVEYAADVDYQEEARQEGINPSGKYQHSLAGLKHLPTDGYYMYRTNPNPETDPWVITGAMKVNRILTRAEQADLVSKAGREPQQIQEGDIVTDDVVNSINQEIADAPKFSLKSKPVRYEAGKKLSDEEKKEVLSTLTDAYKVNGVPYHIEETAGGKEKRVYEPTADSYVVSDITNRPLRYYITLPDGRVAHPTEVYPNISDNEVKSSATKQGLLDEEVDQIVSAAIGNMMDIADNAKAVEVLTELQNLPHETHDVGYGLNNAQSYNYKTGIFTSDAAQAIDYVVRRMRRKEDVPAEIPAALKKAVADSYGMVDNLIDGMSSAKFSLKDNQGNPLNQDGTLKLDKIKSVDELTDEDFLHPTRNVELPSLPKKIADAIGTEGKPVVIKKNIFERNYMRHKDVTPELSKVIFKSALYNPDLYGQNQKKTRPYNWVLINTKDEKGNNRTVLLEVNPNKDNVEIVHWHFVNDKNLGLIKKQAIREGDQVLILPSEQSEEVGGLSNLTDDLSAAKIDNSSETTKENGEKVDVEAPKTFDEFLNHPSLKFSIKNEQQRKAAEDAYEYAFKLRPNKSSQYALVDMSNPSNSPQYYEKKVLADRWRRFYNKAVHNELDDVYKDAWGNYKLFDLDRPFADQVNEVKGDVPSEFNAPDVVANKNADNESGAEYHEYKQDEPSSITYKYRYKAFKQREANREKTAGLRKERKEVEDVYKSKSEERVEYNKQLMKEYMDEHGLSSENDIPYDVWDNLRSKSFEKYQDELDSLFNKYKDLDKQIKAVAEPRFSLKDEKIKSVAEKFGVNEDDVAMYANAVERGSTADAARARANIKRYLLQANEDKISSFHELMKYTVPVNEALKENFGDLDAMIEERRKQIEAERNAMEAARKRAQEEEEKRQKHLDELSLIPTDELDKRYMDAISNNDESTAREMLDESARRKGYGDVDSDYQGLGAWAAPSNPQYESDEARRADIENSPDVNLEDIALGYSLQPDDYFNNPRAYMNNTAYGLESAHVIKNALDAIKNGEKDVKVKVYRAVPTSVKEGKLRNGDWVTPSKKYAEMHGDNRLEGKYRIIEDEVPANQLWWDGNDANEFGFDDGKEYRYKNAKNNRKLNDLITYDNKGNVIPPSKRFNSRKNDIRFSLAGERGAAAADKAEERTFRMDNLSVARKMEEEKKDAMAIKMATGWERGADGKWRYEMPDAKIKDTMNVGGGHIVKRYEDDMLWNGGKLSDVIDAPELFKAYPQLKDVRIETDAIMNDMPSNGEYNSKTNTITIHADELKYMNGILNHEIQHAIQDIEGFAKGGSPRLVRGEVKKRFDEVTKQIKQLRAEGKEDEAKALIEKNRGLYNAYQKNDDYNSYKSLAGEVEARNVSARLNMTSEERRKTLAEFTEDVARKDQIFLGVGDVSFSLRDMADGKESGAADMAEDLKNLNTPDEVDDAIKTAIDDMPSGWQMANKKMIHIAQALGENRKAEIAGEEPKFSLKDGSLIKAGTYFSGGGLVEEGLKGIIDPVVAVEYDEKISGVYRNNFGQHIVTADVRDVDPRELVKQIDGEVEYFHASPVCKNYSQAKSNHAEVELDKETAASTAEFINAIKPKVVTIENVKGYKDSDAMKIITDSLDANGYTWDADVYNAADYGGYTNRERLIVRAVRDGKLPEKPKKMARKSGWYEAVADIIPTLTEKKNGVAPWMDIRLKADGIDWRNIDKPLYVMGSAYADGKVPHAFADELLPTLRTKSGDVIVMPDGKVYRAMGRVLARVSGVSDDYKMPFSENLSHIIIGNGIPTQLTEHVIAPLLQNTLRPTTPEDGNTKFSLRYDQFEHDLNQWKKDNNLPKDAQRPTIPQRNAGESAVDFLRRVDEYRKQMALWKTAPTYEQHLLSDDTALGEFNRELQRGSVLKRIAFQDSMLAIRKAQEAIMKEVGVDRLNMAEDAYTAENRSHGKGKNEFEEYNNEFLQPLRKAYHQMKKILGDSYDNVRIYMMAKHGLERDAQMAFKKSLEADYEDVAQRSAAYKAYKGDMNRIINDSDLEFGRVDFTTWRQRDNALRVKYSPSYMDYRYDKNGIAYDYSGLSALFDGSDFEEAAHKLVKDIESKYVAETHDLWDATNAATKKILRDGYKAGMMSKDNYQYVRDMYSHYIPLRGWDGTTADKVWDYIGGGKGAFNQTLKKAHGRTSIADDPIAYIENMAESGILLNNKNWVKQHLMLLAQNHPTSLLTLSKAWYVKSTDANGNEEWIPATPQITSQMNSNQVKAAIDAFEKKMEQMAQTGDATQKRDGLNIAYPQTHSEEREHEVRVMKDGEEYVIYVNGDPQLAQAMNNTRAHRVREIQSGKLDRAAAWLGRKMAAAYTSLSPLFIPSNYFRDLTMTLASTAIREDGRYNYMLRKNLATSWNLGFMLRDYQNGKLREKVSNGNATPKERMFYDFMMNGGETGFVSSLDVEDLKKKFKNDLKDLDRWKANPVKVGHTIMDGIEFLNRAIEDSNRFAVYMTSIQYGRSIDEAVNDAKDVTLNFNRKGTGEYGWQMVRNLYLFINPAVQSLQTLGALAKHHPFKFTAVTASWLASGVLVPIVNVALMSLLGGDDDKDKYWQFTKWDRRNNLIMWVPFTHEYIKIPLAQEFRAFYGIGDMIASKMMGGELAEESWSQYAEDLLGQVVDMLPLDPTGYDGNIAVSLMPNAIRPVFELAFNVDFTGKPLFKETEYNKYDPNFTKAYVGTPDWLVRISRMVNSIGNDYPDVQQNSIDAFGDPRYNLNNPAVVDHVLSSYLGGAYTMGSQVLGVLTKSLNDPKEIKVADIPLFSKFVSNPDDRPVTKKQGDEFWDMKENHDRAANTLSKLKKQAKVDGDYSMLERFYGSEEYKQYKQDDVKVKKYEEDKKKERAEESGEEYRPHKLNADDIYKAHATPKDDFEDLKLKQLYTKLNGFKSAYDLLVDTAPSQSNGYYNTNKAAIDAIDEISLDKQEISELKKGFLDDGKDAYNAEDMKQIRDLRKKILSVLEKANKVVVANQKAKAEK